MTILCVDASPISLLKLWVQIKRIYPDAEVKCCRSSKEALETVNRTKISRSSRDASQITKWDILITDVDLGAAKGEGLHLAEELKKLYPHVNIIFMATGPEKEYAAQILKMRPSGYLTKPFSGEELSEELCNLRYTLDARDPSIVR